MPDLFDRLRDAANTARQAEHQVNILVTPAGFRVAAQNGGVGFAKLVPFDDVELANFNVLVDAVREAARKVAV